MAAYGEACANYRAIDELRLRLLALLPLATGAGIFLLLGTGHPGWDVTVPVGVFGALATVSLFFYELHGVEKCAHFIHRASDLERSLGVDGPFTDRPQAVFGVVSELLPGAIIYPASLAGWVFVALADVRFGTTESAEPARLVILFLVLAAGFGGAGTAISLRERRRKAEWAEPKP